MYQEFGVRNNLSTLYSLTKDESQYCANTIGKFLWGLWTNQSWSKLWDMGTIIYTSLFLYWRTWSLKNWNTSPFQFHFSHSVVSNSLWPHGLQHTRPPCLSPTRNLFIVMPIESVMLSNHLSLCRLLLLLPSGFPSIRAFPDESALCIRWPKYWSFSFSISPFNEYSGLISFRMDWLDLLAIQRTLKSLFQRHSSKASILLTQISL